jgi:hypothetical protein
MTPGNTDQGRTRGKQDGVTGKIIGVFYEVYKQFFASMNRRLYTNWCN